MSLKADILRQELYGFVTNTNPRLSRNTGPFPNTALQYVAALAVIASRRPVPYALPAGVNAAYTPPFLCGGRLP